MRAMLQVNEARIMHAVPVETADRYFQWAAVRAARISAPLTEWAEFACEDRVHAQGLRDMLIDWGLPHTALRVAAR